MREIIRDSSGWQLLAAAFFAGDGDDVHGVAVRCGGDSFDYAFLPSRRCLDGDVVVAAIGQAGVGEDEIAVLCDLYFFPTLELEHQSFTGESGDGAADGVGVGGAGDGDIIDCRAGDAATALADRTGLFDR